MEPMTFLSLDDQLAWAAVTAVRAGDTAALNSLLAEHPELAAARIGTEDEARSMLHVATDWPGHFPVVAETIQILVAAGADPNATFVGSHRETPLHWAASSNDVAAVDALLDAGADIEAPGSVLGGGSPLAGACGFGQWDAARRLVERGASTQLTDAASLGRMDLIADHFATGAPDGELITMALWSASNGSRREVAAYLIEQGGDVNWIGWGNQTCLDVARANDDPEFAQWLLARDAKTAAELDAT